jgi:hypothetical protein
MAGMSELKPLIVLLPADGYEELRASAFDLGHAAGGLGLGSEKAAAEHARPT